MMEHLQPEAHMDADQVSAFVEGLLPEHEREQTLAHMATCADCRTLVFLAQPEEAAVQRAIPAKEERPAFWSAWLRPVTFAGAAFACLLVVVALRVHRSGSVPPTNVAINLPPTSPQPKTEVPQRVEDSSAAPRVLPSPSHRPVTRTVSPPAVETPKPAFTLDGNTSSAAALGTGSVAALPAQNYLSNSQISPSQIGVANGTVLQRNRSVASTAPAPVINGYAYHGNVYEGAAAAKPMPAPPMAQQALSQTLLPPVGAEQSLANDQVENLPVNGRNIGSGTFAAKKANINSNGLTVTIEHDHATMADSAEVAGTVTDATGAAAAGATVTIRGVADLTAKTAAADASGHFTIAALPAGRYELRVALPGFGTVSRQLELQAKDLALLTTSLKANAATETVQVSAAAPALETNSDQVVSSVAMAQTIDAANGRGLGAVVSLGKISVAIGDGGTLFRHRGDGRWKRVKAVWVGAVSSVEVAGDSFQLKTVAGVVWTSADGAHWRQR